MTRAEFMTRLRRGLAGLPVTTIADIVADHEAHFADAMAAGRSEAGSSPACAARRRSIAGSSSSGASVRTRSATADPSQRARRLAH